MSYVAWSVVFGEQPTAAKWNILGTNDESFHDGTGIDNLAILNRHIAAGAILPNNLKASASSANSWVWDTWTPSYGAGGSMTYTSVTTNHARYIRIGNTIFFRLRATGTTGSTPNNTITATLPVAAINTTFGSSFAYASDTASASGWSFIDGSTVSIRKYDSSNFGIGAGRLIDVGGFYEVAA